MTHRPPIRHAFLFALALLAATTPAWASSHVEESDGADPAATATEQHLDATAAEHAKDTNAASPAAEVAPENPVQGTKVTYGDRGGRPLSGYLAQPQEGRDAPRGAIIVIHEWWGLNDNVRAMTERLAGEGWVALAIDLYRGKSARAPEDARELMTEALGRRDTLADNLRQAHRYLSERIGAQKIGSIGWCFGGAMSLEAALQLKDGLDAAVMYYGRPVLDENRLTGLTAPLLGLFGAEDGSIPVTQVQSFEETLKSLDKTANIHIYEGAGHAFANPTGTRYQAEAAEDAWKKTVEFFRAHLG